MINGKKERSPLSFSEKAQHLFKFNMIAALCLLILFALSGCMSRMPVSETYSGGVLLGLFHEGAQEDLSPVKSIEKKIDKKFASVMWYTDWSTSFPAKDVKRVYKAGYMPHITWEPWFFDDNQKVKLDDILSGEWDEYINKWAMGAANFGKPMFLRWGHEFNGNWYPWSIVENGENSSKFIAAYRKVHDAFTKAGADNVVWVWCVNVANVPHQPWNAPLNAYPGDEYVDWIGLDGYNFSGSDSFKALFAKQYSILTKKLSKPFMVAEFATGGKPEDKSQWIAQMAADLEEYYPAIKAITWFDIDKERDWRLLPNDRIVPSVKESLGSDYFLSDRRLFADAAESYLSERDSYVARIDELIPPVVKKEAYAVKLPEGTAAGQNWSSDKPVSLVSPDGEDDSSASIECGWTSEALFIRAAIKDDVPAWNNKQGIDVWNGDCLEICLGLDENSDPGREFYTEYDFQLGLSPGSEKDGVAPSIWAWGNISDVLKGVNIQVNKSDTGYILECIIPWASLVDDFSPEEGMKLGFDFAIDDTDSSGDREQQLVWNGGSDFYSDPAQWGVLILK